MKKPIFSHGLVPLVVATLIGSAGFSPAQAPANTAAQQAEAYYRKGLAAEEAGDAATAQAAYTQALKANPHHANAKNNLSQLKINYNSVAQKGREAKFGAVVVPEFKVEQAAFSESLNALQIMVEKQTKGEMAVNFIIQDPKNTLAKSEVTLSLKNVPAGGILKYLMEQVGAKARYDEHAIVITPK